MTVHPITRLSPEALGLLALALERYLRRQGRKLHPPLQQELLNLHHDIFISIFNSEPGTLTIAIDIPAYNAD